MKPLKKSLRAAGYKKRENGGRNEKRTRGRNEKRKGEKDKGT
jgi:hypothetical protein